ncbi:hypothetical protein HZC31_07925 [Candidatus Woesearchaeota archaeon]|nr:hypothetical protein [Candidatus Woesearchaeota archaeon]
MADIKKLLAIKKMKKVQKPAFLRRNFKKNKRARVTGEWRAPKGLHNKLRRRRRGIGQWVMPGYRMPVAVRGMTREGLLPTVVENLEQMKALDAAKQIAIIKASAGKKSRIEMVKEAVKKKAHIQNIKDAAAYLKQIEEEMTQRKKAKKEHKKVETKPAEKKTEKKEEKAEKKEEAVKEQKEQEKKEQEKVLTKRE